MIWRTTPSLFCIGFSRSWISPAGNKKRLRLFVPVWPSYHEQLLAAGKVAVQRLRIVSPEPEMGWQSGGINVLQRLFPSRGFESTAGCAVGRCNRPARKGGQPGRISQDTWADLLMYVPIWFDHSLRALLLCLTPLHIWNWVLRAFSSNIVRPRPVAEVIANVWLADIPRNQTLTFFRMLTYLHKALFPRSRYWFFALFFSLSLPSHATGFDVHYQVDLRCHCYLTTNLSLVCTYSALSNTHTKKVCAQRRERLGKTSAPAPESAVVCLLAPESAVVWQPLSLSRSLAF